MPSESQARLQRELAEDLRRLENRKQKRSLTELVGVNLCSNDYLGLATHPKLREAIVQAVQEAPRIGGTGSRLLSGHLAEWDVVEADFAQFAGTEAALYFSSGYAANLGLLTSLVGRDDVVFSDARNHASLIDGMRLARAQKEIYRHLDLDSLEEALKKHAHARGRKVIVTESVFSMDGDCAPIAEMVKIAERYGAGMIVDEAHAVGVHGPSGRGLVAAARAEETVWAVVHPCGKALASVGAMVCGSELLKQHLVNHARTLIFSTAQPPYMARQVQAALRLAKAMETERALLLERSRRFCSELRNDGWDTAGSTTQIVPVIIGANAEALAAAEHLQGKGFAVRAIRPPTVPEGQARLRLSLTCDISSKDLERLRSALGAWRERCVLTSGAARA